MDIDKIKQKLEASLTGIESSIFCDTSLSPSLSDDGDRATEESSRSFDFRLKERAQEFGGEVRHALEKINVGTYGTCESCDSPINFRRLLAQSATRYCVECQSDREGEAETGQGR